VGDANGNTAAIDFGEEGVILHKNENMPVPALFNSSYARELEVLSYYKGFGGLYDIDLNDPEVPRFVKTAKLIADYDVRDNIVDYSLDMLETIQVYDYPEWSVVCDVINRKIYFRTRKNKEIKTISLNKIDFSNNSSAMTQNMDIAEAGDVTEYFVPYTAKLFSQYIENELFTVLPEPYFTQGGISLGEFAERFSGHTIDAAKTENQYFSGMWESGDSNKESLISLSISTRADAVYGEIVVTVKDKKLTNSYDLDHIHMIGNKLQFTYHNKSKKFIEAGVLLTGEELKMKLQDVRYTLGDFILKRDLNSYPAH